MNTTKPSITLHEPPPLPHTLRRVNTPKPSDDWNSGLNIAIIRLFHIFISALILMVVVFFFTPRKENQLFNAGRRYQAEAAINLDTFKKNRDLSFFALAIENFTAAQTLFTQQMALRRERLIRRNLFCAVAITACILDLAFFHTIRLPSVKPLPRKISMAIGVTSLVVIALNLAWILFKSLTGLS